MARKHNYLNNKDLLKEIHKSKNSYCVFRDKELDNEFDIILDSVEEITLQFDRVSGHDENGDDVFEKIDNIQIAKENRAKRLAKAAYDQAIKDGLKVKQADFAIDPNDYADGDVVFRINTFEHIPLAPPKESKAKPKRKKMVQSDLIQEDDVVDTKAKPTKYVKVNFPPFYHYRYVDDELIQVAKSHWKGVYDNGAFIGEFCIKHGNMTEKLAMMYMKLCERYATKANWRGYCVDAKTEALTQRGWLSEDQITDNDKILSYNGSNMIWSDIHSIFRDNYCGLMHKLSSRSIDSLITPEHKVVTDKGLVKIEYLKEADRLVVMGEAEETDFNKVYTNEFVELAGWIVTEGNYQPKKKIITIYQNEGPYADRIRQALSVCGYDYTERKSKKSENISFSIKRKHWDEIVNVLENKNLSMDFILNLTQEQRELLINTMVDGDGHRNGLLMRYTQKDKEHMDHFQTLCALSGLKSNAHFVENKKSFGKPVSYYIANVFSKRGNHTRGACIDMHGGKNNGRKHPGMGKFFHPNEPTKQYDGTVWCPETDWGSFLARRNGKVYLTGNTYNDEMRGQGLLQLSMIGLQFNEAKSQNPFAYYTAVVNNAFTRVLNIEKRNQATRDNILEANDLTPSYTRQNENDMAMMKERQEAQSR